MVTKTKMTKTKTKTKTKPPMTKERKAEAREEILALALRLAAVASYTPADLGCDKFVEQGSIPVRTAERVFLVNELNRDLVVLALHILAAKLGE